MRENLIFAALLLVVSPAFAADWPNYLGPDWNGTTSESPGSGAPKKLWEKNVGMGSGSFATKAGVVMTMGNDANGTSSVVCLKADSGDKIWEFTFGSESTKNNFKGGRTPYYGGPNSTPTIDGENVYVLGRFGQLFCLDLRSGKKKWDWDWRRKLSGTTLPQWSYAASPYVKGDHLFVEPGGKGNSVVCLDKNSGEVVWKAGDDGAAYSTPRVLELAGKPTLVCFNAFGLVGRDPSDGSEFWRMKWKTNYDVNSASPPAVGKDKLFVSSGYGTGCTMQQVTGSGLKELWKNKNMKNKHTVSVLHDGALYGFDEADLVCLDPDNGEQHWSEKGYGKGGLIVADGKLVILGENGKLAIGDASTKGFKASYDEELFGKFHCWNHPVISNGKLFVRDVKGNVIAMEVGS